MVKEKVWETNDTCSFILAPLDNQDIFSSYEAGQFVTLFIKINGELVSRSYSFSSSRAVDENAMITVKRVENGIMSNYLLDQVNEGQTVKIAPPTGHFFKKKNLDENSTQGILLFGAGSGVTPLYSILKYSLQKHPQVSVLLVNSNSTENDIIFKDQLSNLNAASPQLNVKHYISQVGKRLSDHSVKDEYLTFIKERGLTDSNTDTYLCGPETYMNMIQETLIGAGHAPDRIFRESFNTQTEVNIDSLNRPKESESPQVFIECTPDDFEVTENKTITAIIDNEEVTIENTGEDNVLEALLNAGEAPPFSCMAGSCSACLCKIIDGKILQKDIGILSEAEVASGRFLSCQSIGVSESIKFEYIED
ncbi:MAG: iron-sulfur cluster-binding domain-containing protein [Bdellovibrionales bacterium]